MNQPHCGAFADKVEVELSRAERYRVFVSLSVLDLTPAGAVAGDRTLEVLREVMRQVKSAIRASDEVALLHDHCLAVLLPETPRQGAEIAMKRLTELVKGKLVESLGAGLDRVIPVEIASYPDTAGARTLTGFLEELEQRNRN